MTILTSDWSKPQSGKTLKNDRKYKKKNTKTQKQNQTNM